MNNEKKIKSIGFGVPVNSPLEETHHAKMIEKESVFSLVMHLPQTGRKGLYVEQVEMQAINKGLWEEIKGAVKNDMNLTLGRLSIDGGDFESYPVCIDRLLALEVALLIRAVKKVNKEDLHKTINDWLHTKQEVRWGQFTGK